MLDSNVIVRSSSSARLNPKQSYEKYSKKYSKNFKNRIQQRYTQNYKALNRPELMINWLDFLPRGFENSS
jgi:hypothetical protein